MNCWHPSDKIIGLWLGVFMLQLAKRSQVVNYECFREYILCILKHFTWIFADTQYHLLSNPIFLKISISLAQPPLFAIWGVVPPPIILEKGPSKNHVTARGRRESTIFSIFISLLLFRGEGGYFTKQLRNGRHKIWKLKECFLGSLVYYKIIRKKFMDLIFPVNIAKYNSLI